MATPRHRLGPIPLDRLDTLPERISRYPTPVGGLALGIASLGLAWTRAYPGLPAAGAGAAAAAVLLVLLTVRFVLHPDTLRRDLGNPVAGSIVPTYAMGWMLVSISVQPFSGAAATVLWLTALCLHVVFLAAFARRQARGFRLNRMVPSWFVPPVGIIVAAVSYRGPDTGPLHGLALSALYFGMVAYALMLPVMLARLILGEPVPQSAQPTIAVLAAPASLSLVGYLWLIEDPQPLPLLLLQGIAVLMTATVYVSFVRLLALPFSPGFAAFTFPVAISATAQLAMSAELAEAGFPQHLVDQIRGLGLVELFGASAVIGYVAARFAGYAWQHWTDAHGPAAGQ